MKTVLKRLLAVVLTLVMVVSSVPMTAFSAESDVTFAEVSKVVRLEKVDTYYYGSENNYGNSKYAYVCYKVLGSDKIPVLNPIPDMELVYYVFFKDNKLVTNETVYKNLIITATVNNISKNSIHITQTNVASEYEDIVNSQELIKIAREAVGAVSQALGSVAADIASGGTASASKIASNILAATADAVEGYLTNISKMMGVIFTYVVSKGIDQIKYNQNAFNTLLRSPKISKSTDGASVIYDYLLKFYQSISFLTPLIGPYTSMNEASFWDLVAEFSFKAMDGFM